MSHRRPAKLVLGTVQLGLAYGAANRTGKPSRATAMRLVEAAVDGGIAVIDTARAYGDAEEILGEALGSARVITKLSPLAELAPQAGRVAARDAVDCSIAQSLAALKRRSLDGLLLHRASHMTACDGAVWQRLVELQAEGAIDTLGVSVQNPEEALAALDCQEVGHLQLPFNLLDWRWRESGAIDRLRVRCNLTVHVRSVYLQGILASPDPAVWPKLANADAPTVIGVLRSLARTLDRESVADLCLAFARGQDWIDGVIIGMETEDQLQTNLRLFQKPALSPEECAEISHRIPRAPIELLNPALWPKRG